MTYKESGKAAKWLKRFVLAIVALAIFVFFNNTSMFSNIPQGRPRLLAHRGVAQTFPIEGFEWNTRVFIVDGNGKWSEGFDSLEEMARIPAGFTGYVWTNRVDRLSSEKTGKER